ncbi:transcriptional regulator ATRX homolog isoform X2 [Neocloeon triangulifer]|uniref:transcriptional regulator ATRX homolog isoform X2 n=1 Tax=Neocloeon triangulifer TaxID=2078957 RepID=UPI00286F34E8|nr:transcriptional regulator ATRX homolog isoform X2 [Neocloeon triangulifer]
MMEMIEVTAKEREWRRQNEEDIESKAEDMKRPCSVCRTGVFSNDVHIHPVLGVCICKKCYKFYNSGDFSEDEEGDQKYCTWCGEGGKLNYCSGCKKGAFCKTCIKNNLAEKEFEKVAADDWHCYLCNIKPLWKLRAYCDATVKRIERKKREKLEPNMLQLLRIKTLERMESPKKGGKNKESTGDDESGTEDDESGSEDGPRVLKKRNRTFVAADDEDPNADPSSRSSEDASDSDDKRSRARYKTPTQKARMKFRRAQKSNSHTPRKRAKSSTPSSDSETTKKPKKKKQKKNSRDSSEESPTRWRSGKKSQKTRQENSSSEDDEPLKNVSRKSKEVAKKHTSKKPATRDSSSESSKRTRKDQKIMEKFKVETKIKHSKTSDVDKVDCPATKEARTKEPKPSTSFAPDEDQFLSSSAEEEQNVDWILETLTAFEKLNSRNADITLKLKTMATKIDKNSSHEEVYALCKKIYKHFSKFYKHVGVFKGNMQTDFSKWHQRHNSSLDEAEANGKDKNNLKKEQVPESEGDDEEQAPISEGDDEEQAPISEGDDEEQAPVSEGDDEEPAPISEGGDEEEAQVPESDKGGETDEKQSVEAGGVIKESDEEVEEEIGDNNEQDFDTNTLLLETQKREVPIISENEELAVDEPNKSLDDLFADLYETEIEKKELPTETKSKATKKSEIKDKKNDAEKEEKSSTPKSKIGKKPGPASKTMLNSKSSGQRHNEKSSEKEVEIEVKEEYYSACSDEAPDFFHENGDVTEPDNDGSTGKSAAVEKTDKTDNSSEKTDFSDSDTEVAKVYQQDQPQYVLSEDLDLTNKIKEEESKRLLLMDDSSDTERKEEPKIFKKKKSIKNQSQASVSKEGKQKIKVEQDQEPLPKFEPSNWVETDDSNLLSNHRRKSRQADSDAEIDNLCNLDAIEKPTSVSKSSKPRPKSKKTKSLKNEMGGDSELGDNASPEELESDNGLDSGPKKVLTALDSSDEENEAKKALLSDSDDEAEEVEDETKEKKKKVGKKVKLDKSESDQTSCDDKEEKNAQWTKAKELNTRLDLDSSEEEIVKAPKKKLLIDSDDSDEDYKDIVAVESNSDDEFEDKKKTKKRKRKPVSESESSDFFDDVKNKKKRKRIVQLDNSTDSECEVYFEGQTKLDESGSPNKLRKRKILKNNELEIATQSAAKEEKERLKRQEELQQLYNKIKSERVLDADVKELVLEFDPKTKEPLIQVHEEMATKLKPHQVKGIKFMWDSVFESIERAKKSEGSGCILAHCMGLGKTLQVVALVHTILTNKLLEFKTVIIVTPLTTVENWKNEFAMWTKDIDEDEYSCNVFTLSNVKRPTERKAHLESWMRRGGVMIVSYDLYRIMANPESKAGKPSDRKAFQKTLIDPGPDIIICDEGHVLKNEDKKLSIVMSRIRTKRRIVMTGTPLQNNLIEYHCMMQFVKPNFLGNRKEFTNRFVNPIKSGQHKESTPIQVKIMKKRACVLHKMLEPSVQRYDYSVLQPHLQDKFEYVIKIRLSEIQLKLYSHFLANCARKMTTQKGACLFSDYQNLLRVWNHPYGLKLRALQDEEKEIDSDGDSVGSLKDFIDDGSGTPSTEDSEASVDSDGAGPSKRCTRQDVANGEELPGPEDMVTVDAWWRGLITENELEMLSSGSKMVLLFSILKECQEIGDKLLVFSQSLYALELIEFFLKKLSNATDEEREEYFCGLTGRWNSGLDYFRIDGKTSIDNRGIMIKRFNNPKSRAKLFLVSTRAGGLGVNMVGANRVILFDASWNPSNDMQSIFRVYRFGQTKPCYIYRFLAAGTMEEKIYDRQVTKLALSGRVVDKQTIDRHYTQADLEELYSFEPYEEQIMPSFPKDRLLAEMYKKHKELIQAYFEHDSLLEDRPEEKLTEEEMQAAWEEFEREKDIAAQRKECNNFNNDQLLQEQRLAAMQQIANQRDNQQYTQQYLNNLIRENLMRNPNLQGAIPNASAANTLSALASNINPANLYGAPYNAPFQNHVSQAQRDHGLMNNFSNAASALMGQLANYIPGLGTSNQPTAAPSVLPRAAPAPFPVPNDDIQVLPTTSSAAASTGTAAIPNAAGPAPILQVRKDLFK